LHAGNADAYQAAAAFIFLVLGGSGVEGCCDRDFRRARMHARRSRKGRVALPSAYSEMLLAALVSNGMRTLRAKHSLKRKRRIVSDPPLQVLR
jgi:hypothetical protein